jgi:hypothetical protein
LTGKADPSATRVVAIAEVLGISCDELLGRKGILPNAVKDDKNLCKVIDLYQELSSDGQKRILHYVKFEKNYEDNQDK